MSLLTGQDETTEDVLAVRRVQAAGKAAEDASEVAEKPFRQILGFQAIAPGA